MIKFLGRHVYLPFISSCEFPITMPTTYSFCNKTGSKDHLKLTVNSFFLTFFYQHRQIPENLSQVYCGGVSLSLGERESFIGYHLELAFPSQSPLQLHLSICPVTRHFLGPIRFIILCPSSTEGH